MSNGRGLPPQFETNIAQPHVTSIVLVRMTLDSGTLYMTDAPHDVTWDGQTWVSLYGMASVGEVAESDGEVHGLQFTLSGVPTASIALALTENIQGRPVELMLATLNGTTLSVDENAWVGKLDVMQIGMDGNTCRITVTAEHPLARWDQPNLLRFSHEDQQRLHPGDQFFQFAERIATVTITWPAKEFFEK